MNKYSFEMNSARRDKQVAELNANSDVVKVFAAQAMGKDTSNWNKGVVDNSMAKIASLATAADNGDVNAISELNTIRKYVIEAPLLEELKALSFFGSYENVGYGDSIEREVQADNINVREQAANGDVPLSFVSSTSYPVASQTISAGYQVDYRKLQFGDMSAENRLIENIKTTLRNKAMKYSMDKILASVRAANYVNYSEGNSITKIGVDDALKFVRRFGAPTIIGDYSVVSQINDFANYANSIPYYNISQEAMNEIRKSGYVSSYNGAAVVGIQNPFDLSAPTTVQVNSTTKNSFKTIAPEGLLFVVPTGIDSPVKLWTRGGLTSMSGTDVTTGRMLTRYDIEVAVDVAKGKEYEIGVVRDLSLSPIA